ELVKRNNLYPLVRRKPVQDLPVTFIITDPTRQLIDKENGKAFHRKIMETRQYFSRKRFAIRDDKAIIGFSVQNELAILNISPVDNGIARQHITIDLISHEFF